MDRLLLLRNVSLLEGLTTDELEVLDRTVIHTNVSKGTIVQSPGEGRSEIVFIKKGKLRVYRQSPEGKEFTVGLLGEGNVFGDVKWFGLGTQNASIDVFEDAITCTLSEQKLQSLIEGHPMLSLRFMQVLTEQLQRMEELLTVMAIGSLRWKVLFVLQRLAEDFGVVTADGWASIALRVSQQDIASMTGASRESVTRVMQELVKDEMVETDRTHFRIQLARVAEELAQR